MRHASIVAGAAMFVAFSCPLRAAERRGFAAVHAVDDGMLQRVGPNDPAAGPEQVSTLEPAPLKTEASSNQLRRKTRRHHEPKSVGAVRAMNRRATREPDPKDYVGAAQIYRWTEGALYRLYAAPEEVSDIALEEGETLVSVASGDTARWIIGDTASGSGANRRVHILVKPSSEGLRTNLVIATDRRVYHVEAISTKSTNMAAISWVYPEDSLVALRGRPATTADSLGAALALDNLNFDYRIDGDKVSWRPLRAFDDGHRTFIQFPASFGDGEAPPLFVSGERGEPQLVNYRVQGRYYIVDQLFGAAELRIGEKRQKVVRITRQVNSAGKGGQ